MVYTRKEFEEFIETVKKENPLMIAVVVEIHDEDKIVEELIVNYRENFDYKFKYYLDKYNENMEHRFSPTYLRIIKAVYADTLHDLTFKL